MWSRLEGRKLPVNANSAVSFTRETMRLLGPTIANPERMNCPSMNRVLDGLHDVPGETIRDRVRLRKSLEPTGRSCHVGAKKKSNTADIGPGHYDIHRYNDQYGPTHSNLLKMSEVESGRGRRIQSLLLLAVDTGNMALQAEQNPKKETKIVEESGMLGAQSSLRGVRLTWARAPSAS